MRMVGFGDNAGSGFSTFLDTWKKEGETWACLASVKNLMANLNLTLEQTMEMLGMEPEMKTACRNRLR